MLLPARRRRATLLMLVVALLAALVVTGPGPAAQAADQRVLVYGSIDFPRGDDPGVKMLWFDNNWQYLGQQRANGGGYSLRLPPGTYYLQFVDQRPAYDITKYAPTDVRVRVASRPVRKNVTMRPGAAITGTAEAGGRPLRGARVVAANKAEQSFTTTANKRGQFALGGLPEGQYCLFTFDKARKYVDKCTWVGAVAPRQVKNAPVRLRKRAGGLTVFLTTPTGIPPRSTVTVTSNKTGQWWTTTARQGKAVLNGLFPGGYTIKYDAAGIWLAQSGAVRNAAVKSRDMAFGDFRVSKRGGWVSGVVVDSADGTRTLAGAVIGLFAADGRKLAETTSDEDGAFDLVGAITTQSGLTVVLQPGPYSDYLGQEPLVCQYVRTEVGGFAVRTGEETYAGDLGIDRKSPQTKPGCEA